MNSVFAASRQSAVNCLFLDGDALPTCRYDRQAAAIFNRNLIGGFLPKAATPNEIFSPGFSFPCLLSADETEGLCRRRCGY
jgi:hypothetical protein